MAETGKYHGQRLKAKDVLRLYAAGERDFRGTILRGCNFRGADLSGADLSGADIRSARFVDATLRGVKFCHVRAGLQRQWWVGQLILVIVIAAIAGILQGYAGALIGFYFTTGDSTDLVAAIAGVIVIAVCFFAIARQGFTLKALGSVAFAAAFAVAVTISIGIPDVVAAIAADFIIVVVVAVASTVAVATVVVVVVAIAVVIAIAVPNAAAVAITITIASSLFSIYINLCIHRNKLRFENLRVVGLAFAALGGTNFSGADLTEVSFTHSHLKSTNFADSQQLATVLTHIRWHHAQNLDRARLGTANLQDPRVRTLLTTLNGTDQDLSNADLRGANLASAQLHNANLKGANLKGATLQAAELHNANLTKTNCISTDFTAAHLTGATLEAWNINSTTVLKDVDCQFVFLLEHPNAQGSRERRPHNPDKTFQPGDFEKLFKEMLDTVQILIRQGIHPQIFKETVEQLMARYDLSTDAIQGFEKKGEDVLLTVAVPPETDKGQFEQDFDELQALKLAAAKTQGLLEGERKRADDLKAIMLGLGPMSPNLTVNTTAMNQSNNPNITTGEGSFVNTGDMQGNLVNLGEISGQVTNQINQLPDAASNPDQPSLKDLLTQLKAAVETDSELSDDEKAEALSEVAKLAKAGGNPKENAMQRMAKRATTTLKSIAESLTDASKLATACKTLLPMIMGLF
ncbi:MAG: pentapeptide repeat-containing protein [Cyanobacteria bacterium J06635_15]